jgi:hypothetical protein
MSLPTGARIGRFGVTGALLTKRDPLNCEIRVVTKWAHQLAGHSR